MTIETLTLAVDSRPVSQGAAALDNLTAAGGRAEGAAQKLGGAMAQAARSQQAYTVSAAQTAAALRGVPAQFTDIVTSLQGGQKPLTVLLQQGGQLKDMFGGAGAAARALGGYVMGMVNPFTLAAGAATLLYVAYSAGADRAASFNKSLIETGNAAGRTGESLAAMADKISGSMQATRGQVDDAANAVVRSGKVASESLELVTRAVASMASATGADIDKSVAMFVKLADEPAKASAKLNESLNYLSHATYKRIADLESQGNKEAAAALATREAASVTIDRMQAVEAQAGVLQRAWNALAKDASAAWGIMMRIGAPETIVSKLESAQAALNKARAKGGDNNENIPLLARRGYAQGIANLEAEVREQSLRAMRESDSAQATQQRAADNAAKIAAEERLKNQRHAARSQAQIRSDELQQFQRDAKLTGMAAADYAKGVAAINEKYKDAKGPADPGIAAAKREEEAYKSLASSIGATLEMREREAAGVRALTESQRLAIKLDEDLATGKLVLTAAHEQAIRQDLDRLAAAERLIEARKREVEMDRQRAEFAAESEAAYVADQRAIDAMNLSINAYAQSVTESGKALEVELSTLGKTAIEREAALGRYRAELDLRQRIAAVDANKSYTPEQRATATAQVTAASVDAEEIDKAAKAAKRLAEYLDPDKAKDFGDALADAFGGAMNPIKQLTNSFEKWNKAQNKIDQARKDARASIKDETKLQATLSDLRMDDIQNTLGGFGDMAQGAAGFFDKQSKGYKTMMAVSQAFHVAEMAMTIARQGEKAIEAVIAAGTNGDSYTAIARMAAMAAFIAALGVAVSGGGGAAESEPARDVSADIQGAQGTGTVLGDESAKSESIANSLDLLADNSKIELVYTQRMLAGINRTAEGIVAFSATIAKTQGLRGTATDQARWGIGGDTTLVDSGLGFLPEQTIRSIVEQGIQGFGYGTTFTKEKGQDGRAGINKSDFGSEFSDQFTGILTGMIDSVVGAASALGLNNGGLMQRIMDVMPSIGDTTDVKRLTGKDGGGLLSLKGLKGDEINDELNAVFGSIGDQIAQAALPELKSFQHVGEGYLETLIRVSSGIEKADYALEQFGISAIDYTDIVRKSGDTATEIVRQSVMALENTAGGALTGVGQIIDLFVGEYDELIELYSTLRDVRGVMRSVGAAAVDLSADMVRGAGGLEALQTGLNDYLGGFFTDAEQLAAQQARLAEQFADIGVAVPASVEAFRDLVEGLDTSTAEGAHLFGALMKLSGGFADASQAAQDAADAAAEAAQEAADKIAESWRNLGAAIDSVVADFMDATDLRNYRGRRIAETLSGAGINVTAAQVLGASKGDFLALFESIDQTSTAGREQATALLQVWSAFKALNPALAETVKTVEDLRGQALATATTAADASFAKLQASLNTARTKLTEQYNEAVAAMQKAQAEEQTRQQEAIAAQQSRLSDLQQVFEALDNALKDSVAESDALNLARRNAARGALSGMASQARRGVAVDGMAGLEQALATVAEPSEDLYKTFEEYAFDQAKTANDIYTLRSAAGAQVSVAEMTLQALQNANKAAQVSNGEQLAQLKATYDSDMAALAAQEAFWQEQLNAYKGIDDRVLSVREAVDRMTLALATLGNATRANGGYGADQIRAAWNDTGAGQNDVQIKTFYDWMRASGTSMASIDAALSLDPGRSAKWAADNGLPSFDVGTSRVPRDMAALIHKDEAVLTPAQADQWRSGGTDMAALVNEVRMLREQVRADNVDIRGNTKSTALSLQGSADGSAPFTTQSTAEANA